MVEGQHEYEGLRKNKKRRNMIENERFKTEGGGKET